MPSEKKTPRWSESQKAAFGCLDRTLLVSAAAGAGKTATLTERIIRSLLDKDHPADIGSMLIVTYTNAAVAELRQRIGAALRAALTEEIGKADLADAVPGATPADRTVIRNLERQLCLLPGAKISTISSYCNSLVRKCADDLGIPPTYRVADAAESDLLALSTMEHLINSTYDGDAENNLDAGDFAELVDCLTDTKSDVRLSELLVGIYRKTQNTETGVASLSALVDLFRAGKETKIEDTPFFSLMRDRFRETVLAHRDDLSSALRGVAGDPKEEKNLPMYETEIAHLSAIADLSSYREIREALAFSFGRKHTVREKSAESAALDAARKSCKDALGKLRTEFFSYEEADLPPLFENLSRRLRTLSDFLFRFDEVYREEKQRRAVCDFGDLERYAYEALWRHGELTDFAHAERALYDFVYIDEYQDVSSLEDRIFDAVSKENNRFMVGDIKQSIYSFRSANPDVFAAWKARLPLYDPTLPGKQAKIFMSDNFRSDRAIIDFANGVFDEIFGLLGESIGYDENDRLRYKKIQETEPPYRTPEIHIVLRPQKQETSDTDAAEEGEPHTAPDEDPDAAKCCAEAIAKKIGDLLKSSSEERKITPKDIAVLLRKTKTSAPIYAAVFRRHGIPCEIPSDDSFFLNADVLLTLCLLNTIDNPRRDIYLAGLLCSPLCRFTADDLCKIRAAGRGLPLIEALRTYAKNGEDRRACEFLSALGHYRAIASGMGVDELLLRLYRETGLLSLAAKDGGEEQLILLYHHARSFVGDGFRDLYSFISYINRLIEKEKSFSSAASAAERDVVRIQSIHQSKGLQYKICFLGGCESPFNIGKDTAGPLAYAPDFGIALELRSEDQSVKLKNPISAAVRSFIRKKAFEEELRVLYVALTRPVEELYIYAAKKPDPPPKAEGEPVITYRDRIADLRGHLTAYRLSRLNNQLDLLLATQKDAKIFWEEPLPEDPAALYTEPATPAAPTATDASLLEREVTDRLSFVYPRVLLTSLPAKLAVSTLRPRFLDDPEDTALSLFPEGENDETDEKFMTRGTIFADFAEKSASADKNTARSAPDFCPTVPAFLSEETDYADESARRGIATHTYMQFCDFSSLQATSAGEELDRLVRTEFLTKENAALVRLGEIEKFRQSRLFREMCAAKALYRELRFHVRIPATEFTDDPKKKEALLGEDVLVQGVIDCVVERENGDLILIDYKTDRLSRAELTDPARAAEKLIAKHSRQLGYYRKAVAAMFGRPAAQTCIYSLPLGDTVLLPS